MDSIYGVVISFILLFPWSLVAAMLAGALWTKIKGPDSVRHSR